MTEREGTLENIRSQKEFVINVVSSELGNQMQKTAENSTRHVNEFEEAQLTPILSDLVKPLCVKEAPIEMESLLENLKTRKNTRG
ncbi:flavin reductase [Fictibacillus terranigra]|uniref:Flavin reductase n=1 Tax=Fictibacillus terranigra TaxID=3058424 RepID=A0ABT8E504_9BACL|nr:flavin reductase [Fictibacillus sp. CENA-BCM004]MDN4072985.1 flavin reductase [Fictibacillus sp. CENA-BCM004]